MGKADRRIKNYLLMPKLQLKYVYYLIAIVNAPLSLMLAYIVFQIEALKMNVAVEKDVPLKVSILIADTGWHLTVGVCVTILVIIIFSFIGTVLISHRFVGPMYVINQCLEAMRRGDYNWQRDLRKEDEMQQTMELLKKLSSELNKN